MASYNSDIPIQVLRALYNEFLATGDNVRKAKINAILKNFGMSQSPGDSKTYLETEKSLVILEGTDPFCSVKWNGKDLIIIEQVSNKNIDIETYINWSNISGPSLEKKTDMAHKPLQTGTSVTEAQFKDLMKMEKIPVDDDLIKVHLEHFVYSVKWEDAAYRTGDITIKRFKNENDISSLISAGTKVLDGIVFVSMLEKPESQGLFKIEQVENMSAQMISSNLTDGKRAILAAMILVVIQGSLPTKGQTDREVPTFIKQRIYKGEVANLAVIAEQLSTTSTEKFPAHLFIKLDFDKLTLPVATRCKLSIAGNRVVRYAAFASHCKKARDIEYLGETNPSRIQAIVEMNNRIKHAHSLVDILRFVATDYKLQLRMHPLSADKTVQQNFTLKLTRAIIESIEPSSRVEIFRKATKDKNNAFLRDENFVGREEGGVHSWPILENPDADFSSITQEALKRIYGM